MTKVSDFADLCQSPYIQCSVVSDTRNSTQNTGYSKLQLWIFKNIQIEDFYFFL